MRWEELPMASRARLMAAAVRNGYTDIRSIKEAYANYLDQKQTTGNRFDEGGSVDNDEYHASFNEWKKAIAEHHHLDIDNDNTYDYMGFYYSNPARAWAMLDEDSDSHFTDEFKTASHPIFSNLSTYSGKYDPVNNPLVATGGTWTESPNTFTLPEDWYKGPSIQERIQYLEDAENNGVTMYMPDGSLPVLYNNEPWGGVLPTVEITNQNAYGGNLFAKGSLMSNAKPQYNNIGGVQGFLNLLDKKGIKYIKSSGYRPNAKTKSGNDSWHSKLDQWGNSLAVDLVFSDFDKARKAIYSDPELVAYLMNNKLGLLEETTPGVLAKTGGTGKHFHLGPDRWALQMRDNVIKQFGATYHPMQDVTWQDVQARKKQFELTPEEERLYNSKPTLFYNADYTDWNNPTTTKTFELAYAPYALNPELDSSTSNGWTLYNSLLNAQSLNDPLSWMTAMASLSPKTTPQQKEAANTMYQLFAPQGDDYMYHGLNFAAYGGNLFRGGGKKNRAVSVGGVTAGSRAGTEQCAKYSNSYLRDNGYIANGNAWNQGGGSVVFSGYDGLERPAVFDKKAVEAYNNAASDNVWNNFDSNTLDKDSVYTVNMYYKGSPYLEEAFKNGTKGRTGTHTGYLKYENGDWYVVHNIHGKVHVDRFKNIQGGNKKYGVTGIYAPRTNNIFNRAITKLGFGYGGNLFHKGGLEDQFANTYLGIGQFPDYDSDFIATNNLQYLPYSQLNMMGHDPENIRIGNQGNQTMYTYDDKNATYLADANGNLVTSPLLRQMTQDYVKEHYGPMLLKAFLSNPDKYWDEYNRYRNSAITFDENGNPVNSGLPPIEKPIEPAAPEFWLLSAGASKAPSALNSVISPLFNMTAVDNMIDDVTPYSSWGNMMSQNAGGPEWAWDFAHPAFAKNMLKLTGDLAYRGLLAAPQTKRAVEVAMRTTGDPNPLGEILKGIKSLPKTQEGRLQLKDVTNYILKGTRQSNRPYRTLSEDGSIYTGFVDVSPENSLLGLNITEARKQMLGNDLIDAYLYGEKIYPNILTYKGLANEIDHPFGSYINKFYPNKTILVYETPIKLDIFSDKLRVPGSFVTSTGEEGAVTSLPSKTEFVDIDTAGHIKQVGKYGEKQAVRESDIWKYNPTDYNARWGKSFKFSPFNTGLSFVDRAGNQLSNKLMNKMFNFGLKLVDDIGNPVITQTPWSVTAHTSPGFNATPKTSEIIGNVAKAIDEGDMLIINGMSSLSEQQLKDIINNAVITPIEHAYIE